MVCFVLRPEKTSSGSIASSASCGSLVQQHIIQISMCFLGADTVHSNEKTLRQMELHHCFSSQSIETYDLETDDRFIAASHWQINCPTVNV